METNWTYSEAEKALGHKMRAKTGRTDECVNCGAMVNDCQNWPGRTGGTVFELCKCAPKLPQDNDEAHRRDAAGGPSGGADCSASDRREQ